MAAFKCVLCLQELPEEERSTEHVFPDAIGGMLLFKDMCKPCNSDLDKVSSGLTSSSTSEA
jgi:hypothetical protein